MKIVVAYSGGLDTSVLLSWLKETYQAEIIAFCADVGQEEEMDGLDAKALRTGAVHPHVGVRRVLDAHPQGAQRAGSRVGSVAEFSRRIQNPFPDGFGSGKILGLVIENATDGGFGDSANAGDVRHGRTLTCGLEI